MATSVSVAVWLKKIGLHSCKVNKTHDKIIASYSKIQEAHLYAKFKGEIYTPYIGISLVRSSGCFYDFFFLVVVGYFQK